MALYNYREKMNDLLDSKFGGDTKKRADLEQSGLMKENTVLSSDKSTEEKIMNWHSIKGEDVDWLRTKRNILVSSIDGISSERWDEFQSGPGPEGRAMMAMHKEERRLEDFMRMTRSLP